MSSENEEDVDFTSFEVIEEDEVSDVDENTSGTINTHGIDIKQKISHSIRPVMESQSPTQVNF